MTAYFYNKHKWRIWKDVITLSLFSALNRTNKKQMLNFQIVSRNGAKQRVEIKFFPSAWKSGS